MKPITDTAVGKTVVAEDYAGDNFILSFSDDTFMVLEAKDAGGLGDPWPYVAPMKEMSPEDIQTLGEALIKLHLIGPEEVEEVNRQMVERYEEGQRREYERLKAKFEPTPTQP